MKYLFGIGVLFLCNCLCLQANNVKIIGKAAVDGEIGSDRTAMVKFRLSWENSWRDKLNWDAVYLFIKYKVDGTDDLWHHAYSETTGHLSSSNALEFVPAKSGDKQTGVFVQRNSAGSGNIEECDIRLKWNIAKGTRPLTKQEFDKGKVIFAVFAIEMVYVPYGAFLCGDGKSIYSFVSASEGPFVIDGENKAFTIPVKGAGTMTLNRAFPKGYAGFYCMKYEMSQEQYVRFLNKLPYEQQKLRIGNQLDELEIGEFIFGDKQKVNFRNGIVLKEKEINKPAVFANDFNKNGVYGEEADGQTIACNYLTPQDMLAYCSWAGLRPMSELEYEKACRFTYPELPHQGGYAWNSTVIVNRVRGAVNQGGANELADQGNVNAGNQFGPIRCGAFAKENTRQLEAGATGWGILEMSGNLSELCYNVMAGEAFIGGHGSGLLDTDVTGWPVAGKYFAVRGGSFASPDSLLRVSDRSQATGNYFSEVNGYRDSTVTFRGIHSISAGDMPAEGPFSAGSIVCENERLQDTVCPDAGFCYVLSQEDAAGGSGNIDYVWYLKGDNGEWQVIEGQTGASLVYTKDSEYKEYTFKRKAICAVGDAFSNEVKVVMPRIQLNVQGLTMSKCLPAVATATLKVPGTITWLTNEGKELQSGEQLTHSTYTPSLLEMGIAPGTNVNTTIQCRAEVAGCVETKPVEVSIIGGTPNFSISLRKVSAVSPAHSLPIKVSGAPAEAKTMWYFDGKPLLSKPLTGASPSIFAPTFDMFSAGGTHKITVQVEQNACVRTAEVIVHVTDAVAAVNCPASVTDNEDLNKNTYTVRKMADGRCWMTTNIRRTDVAFVYPNNVAGNAAAHGCLYSWNVAMAGSTQERARGICPKGWHVATDDEWKNLEMSTETSITIETADALAAWRGTYVGRTLKAASGFNLTLSGVSASQMNNTGYYWTSSLNNSSTAYVRHFTSNENRSYRYAEGYGTHCSVRCVMD